MMLTANVAVMVGADAFQKRCLADRLRWEMSTVLVPMDGSDHAMKALHIACDLATKHGGRIALSNVLSEDVDATDLLALCAACISIAVCEEFSKKQTDLV